MLLILRDQIMTFLRSYLFKLICNMSWVTDIEWNNNHLIINLIFFSNDNDTYICTIFIYGFNTDLDYIFYFYFITDFDCVWPTKLPVYIIFCDEHFCLKIEETLIWSSTGLSLISFHHRNMYITVQKLMPFSNGP